MTLEINLESRSCALLTAHGAHPIKRGFDGEPDREILWGKSLHFWIEFKKEAKPGKAGGKLRPRQELWKKYLIAIGDDYYLIDTFKQVADLIAIWELIYGRATADRDAAFNPTRKRA